MLFLAEGTIHRRPDGDELQAAEAWLGSMTDGGFLQNGYLDAAGNRLWMVLSSDSRAAAGRRLNDLPFVHDGSVSYTLVAVTAVRYS
jgi:hypothetical protein